MQFRVSRNDQEYGPYTLEELQQRVTKADFGFGEAGCKGMYRKYDTVGSWLKNIGGFASVPKSE